MADTVLAVRLDAGGNSDQCREMDGTPGSTLTRVCAAGSLYRDSRAQFARPRFDADRQIRQITQEERALVQACSPTLSARRMLCTAA